MSETPHLFTPLTLRSVEVPNRIVVSPMQQYMAGEDGLPGDFLHRSALELSPTSQSVGLLIVETKRHGHEPMVSLVVSVGEGRPERATTLSHSGGLGGGGGHLCRPRRMLLGRGHDLAGPGQPGLRRGGLLGGAGRTRLGR